MGGDLKDLYARLGYSGPLPVIEAPPSGAPSDSLQADAPPAARAAPYDPAEVPPISLEGIEEFEDRLNYEPEETLARARQVFDKDISEARLRAILDEARMALRSPDTAVDLLDMQSAHMDSANNLPQGFTFAGMDLNEVPIDPGDHKFETNADALGWAINAGPFVLTQPSKKRFRWHSHPDFSGSGFTYKMEEPGQDSPVEVALFSDFGTGRYHSRYIARQLRARQFPYAVHLGDVYYAGRRSEFEKYFADPLDPILPDTELFALNSNHEMYSAGIPYFEFMDKRRAHPSGRQRQEGSYFCLRSSDFQIVGIDTAYFGHGRYEDPDLLEWLAKTLADGKRAGCVNILLSADHPYGYGRVEHTKLLREDLELIANIDKLIDLWFWGNTHYCALFDRTPSLQFIGSCIGHAGYPYDRHRLGKPAPAPVVFLETAARFPAWTNLRQDRGNNGYCVMALKADASVELRYVDWMGNVRFEAALSRIGPQHPLGIISPRT